MEPTVTHRGGAQRRGSITCFSRQEGWTDFYPKRRNETRLPGPFHCQDLSGVVLTRCRLLSVYVIICLKCEFYVWKSPVLLENSICLLALHDEEDNRDQAWTASKSCIDGLFSATLPLIGSTRRAFLLVVVRCRVRTRAKTDDYHYFSF